MSAFNVLNNTHLFMNFSCPKGGFGLFQTSDGRIICDICGKDITNEFENIFNALKVSLKKHANTRKTDKGGSEQKV